MTRDPVEAYEPPAELEGPDSGLIDALASRIWSHRIRNYRASEGRLDFRHQSHQVKDGWRSAAREALRFLFDIGFEGPGGQPQDRTGWTYAWVDECDDWEILDDKGALVALCMNDRDMAMMLAAPRLAAAATALLEEIEGTPARDLPQIQALADALPRNEKAP